MTRKAALLVLTILQASCVNWPRPRAPVFVEPPAPPEPRAGLLLGFGLGLEGMTGRWAGRRSVISNDTLDTQLGLRLRMGVVVHRNVGLFGEGEVSTSLAVDDQPAFVLGLSMFTAGAGVIVFGGDDSWHVSLAGRYGSAGRPLLAQVGYADPSQAPIEFSRTVLGELAAGTTFRTGAVDRNLSGSVMAGPLLDSGGWLVGLALTRTWTLSSTGN